MRKELLTIITPVYNRADLMPRLYRSLKGQENKNFLWLIVDDGSSDEIEEVVQKFTETTDFSIEFYRKENGGKHTALNLAFDNLDTQLAIVVDSDDMLTPKATDIIEYTWLNRTVSDVAGCVFLRGYDENNCIGHSELEDGVYHMVDVMFSHRIDGDKAEMFRCDILKKYRFPEFENERFMGESYIWSQIYLNYQMVYCNKIIYLCEYLEGGLTKQGRKLRLESPLGGMEYAKISFNSQFPLKERIKKAWLYICYGRFAKLKFPEIIRRSGHGMLILLNYIPGVILYLYWKNKYYNN